MFVRSKRCLIRLASVGTTQFIALSNPTGIEAAQFLGDFVHSRFCDVLDVIVTLVKELLERFELATCFVAPPRD